MLRMNLSYSPKSSEWQLPEADCLILNGDSKAFTQLLLQKADGLQDFAGDASWLAFRETQGHEARPITTAQGDEHREVEILSEDDPFFPMSVIQDLGVRGRGRQLLPHAYDIEAFRPQSDNGHGGNVEIRNEAQERPLASGDLHDLVRSQPSCVLEHLADVLFFQEGIPLQDLLVGMAVRQHL